MDQKWTGSEIQMTGNNICSGFNIICSMLAGCAVIYASINITSWRETISCLESWTVPLVSFISITDPKSIYLTSIKHFRRPYTLFKRPFTLTLYNFDPKNSSKNLFSTFMPSKMSENWKSYMLFCRILFQFMPAILMTSLYTTIFLKVREQEQLMSRYTYKQKVKNAQ